jgi:hypothetical protein
MALDQLLMREGAPVGVADAAGGLRAGKGPGTLAKGSARLTLSGLICYGDIGKIKVCLRLRLPPICLSNAASRPVFFDDVTKSYPYLVFYYYGYVLHVLQYCIRIALDCKWLIPAALLLFPFLFFTWTCG